MGFCEINESDLSHHQWHKIDTKIVIVNACLNANDMAKSNPLILHWMDTIVRTQ